VADLRKISEAIPPTLGRDRTQVSTVRKRPLTASAMTQRLPKDTLTVLKFEELIFLINVLSPILSQISPLHTLPSQVVKIYFLVTIQGTFRLPSGLCF
jgi:hypothetical protein